MPTNAFVPPVVQTTIEGRRFGLSVADDPLPAPGRPFSIVSTVSSAGGSNICILTMQVVDREGTAVAGVFVFDWWLSDATSGAGLTTHTASGAVAAGAAGTDLVVMVAKKATRVMTNASGVYNLSITDTGKNLFDVMTNFPMGFKIPTRLQATLAAGDYGA